MQEAGGDGLARQGGDDAPDVLVLALLVVLAVRRRAPVQAPTLVAGALLAGAVRFWELAGASNPERAVDKTDGDRQRRLLSAVLAGHVGGVVQPLRSGRAE